MVRNREEGELHVVVGAIITIMLARGKEVSSYNSMDLGTDTHCSFAWPIYRT
ncbi:hypothetical protein F2Q69_00052782 [Brassica cretica]|uniref:Uncharacterized protein n=1 Tax=Brassica cretica TaxID=69181 RepID=A0A8S9N1N4_BRACR|nr:hypothetical protein F2Q69_00052782 [Brassica cretica]